MRTLNEILNEKLKINKKFKFVRFICSSPKSFGTCLTVYIPLKSNHTKSKIQLSFNDYKKGRFPVITVDGFASIITKNEKSYYTFTFIPKNWAALFLFDDDALEFLNILLENNDEYINVTEFLDDNLIELLQKDLYQCSTVGDEPYDKETIKSFISEIK